MNNKTKENYRTRAKNFYAGIPRKPITPKGILDALRLKALGMTPNSWRVLRNAIEFDQREGGFKTSADKVKQLKNPTTTDNNYKNKKKVPSKVKSITQADEDKLFKRLKEEQCNTVFAVILLVKHLGCRPAELYDIDFLENGLIHIPSAKKTDTRGLDRIIHITGTDAKERYRHLQAAHHTLLDSNFKDPVRYVQNRLLTVSKQLWPQRKKVPCLYTWRHQMGADLKASGKSRKEIAALMGHLSVESICVYGRPRKARSKRDYITADKKTIAKVLDTKPSIPPSQRKSFQPNHKVNSPVGGLPVCKS